MRAIPRSSLARLVPARLSVARTLCSASKGNGAEAASAKSSEWHQQPGGPSDHELRVRVLETALLEVPSLGWSAESLSAGAVACGLSPVAHGLLPRGPVELVEFFSGKCDRDLSEQMEARHEELAALEVHNRLLVAMQERLRLVEPYRASWPQALALRALPTNLPNTLRDAHSLASLLLDTCGEDAKVPLLPHAVDPHVKMMSIGAIYGAAELHMLTDSSPGLNDTWTFLEREVDALRTMASTTNRMPDISPAALLVNLLMRK